jgi:hypothetical protein
MNMRVENPASDGHAGSGTGTLTEQAGFPEKEIQHSFDWLVSVKREKRQHRFRTRSGRLINWKLGTSSLSEKRRNITWILSSKSTEHNQIGSHARYYGAQPSALGSELVKGLRIQAHLIPMYTCISSTAAGWVRNSRARGVR